MEPTLNKECPAALAAEAGAVWELMVKRLRGDGTITFSVAWFRYDAVRDALILLGGNAQVRVQHEEKPAFASGLRYAVRSSGANCVFVASDAWLSPSGYPGRPSQAPDRRECLLLSIERQSGDGWNAIQYYTRVGSRVFIPDAMPELRYQSVQPNAGIMQNFWSPKPVPSNN